MTRSQDIVSVTTTVLTRLAPHLPAYDRQIEFMAEPSMAGGNGRGSGVSDPTAGAVQNAEKWLNRQRQLRADLVGLLHSVRAVEREMLAVLAEAPLSDRERMRASCKEVFCGKWASVNPKTQQADKKGFCVDCWRDERSAQRAEQRATTSATLDAVAAVC